MAGKDRGAEARGGPGRRLPGRSLRRPAGRVRTGRGHGRDHARLRRAAPGAGPAGPGDRVVGPQGAARHSGAGISGGAAAGLRPGGGGRDRLRLRRRPTGRDDAPVLQRRRPRRLPHHHALQPALFQRIFLRNPARIRPRHLRTGSAGRAPRHAARELRLAGNSRIAIAIVGESSRPRPGVLGPFLPEGTGDVSRKRCAT